MIAIKFAQDDSPRRTGNEPQLIVLSVPASNMIESCGEQLLPAGSVLKPLQCTQYQDFRESEVDLVLFPNAEDVIGRFPIEPKS